MGETDWRKLGLVLMGRAMLSKSLIQFSVDGQGCVPSLLFDLLFSGDILNRIQANPKGMNDNPIL